MFRRAIFSGIGIHKLNLYTSVYDKTTTIMIITMFLGILPKRYFDGIGLRNDEETYFRLEDNQLQMTKREKRDSLSKSMDQYRLIHKKYELFYHGSPLCFF